MATRKNKKREKSIIQIDSPQNLQFEKEKKRLAMENSSSSSELQKLIEAIKISEVVEGRTELIAKLADLHLSEQSDVKSLAESLLCLLNKTVLHVAAKYLDSDISGCLLQFLLLGSKASIWCGKHLKMTVMSTEESPEEEHCSLFYQVHDS
ncbi:hypothetical protein Goshw_019511 [Gossypium schwendimanii]|uniref:Uncharacterized protein n=1 Tax=Gossypium schwendimanii TaxID=34291 RepID=A0A7J9LGY6_GOSSC|nr:hypothetical protein [Gossypium schwendimanii]